MIRQMERREVKECGRFVLHMKAQAAKFRPPCPHSHETREGRMGAMAVFYGTRELRGVLSAVRYVPPVFFLRCARRCALSSFLAL